MKLASFATALLFLLIYVLPLGTRPLLVPDEARYCEIPREMIRSGDWIVPRLDGVRYFEKPVLGYWAVAASMLIFGENSFACRLPSALSVGGAAIVIAILIRRFGNRGIATVFAPAVFMTCLGVFSAGIFNVLDSLFAFLVTAALASYYVWHAEHERTNRAGLLALAGAASGLAFLVKGFVAFAVVGIVIVPFAIWERRARDLLRMAWLPIGAAVLVALPWSIAILRREPDFWRYFFWVQHVERFSGSIVEQHEHPFWFLVPFLLIGTFPWNLFLGASAAGLRRTENDRSFLRFLVCWALFPFFFFSCSRGKLGTYILPCYPPLAILMSVGLVNYLQSGRRGAFIAGAAITACMAGLGAAFLLIQRRTGLLGWVIFGPGESRKLWLAVIGLAAWLLLVLLATRAFEYRSKLVLCCAAPVLILMLAPSICPVEEHADRMPEGFLKKHSDRIDTAAILVSDRTLAHALCWFFHRTDVFLLSRRAGELEYGLGYRDCDGRLLDFAAFRRLVAGAGHRRVVMILPAQVRDTYLHYLSRINLADRLPPPKFEVSENHLWIGEF